MERNSLLGRLSRQLFWIGLASFAVWAWVTGYRLFQLGVLGYGGEKVCAVELRRKPVRLPGLDHDGIGGVTASYDHVRWCDAQPVLSHMIWDAVANLVPWLVAVVSFVLLWRLVGAATRQGPFSRVVPGRVDALGAWLLFCGLVAPLAEGAARQTLLAEMVEGVPMSETPWSPTILITGVGLLTLGRIMRMGTTMREDLEGTV
ncbi:MAG: DUF2975 domain-containing protein [Nonomuraea sp.]|nr:DUF2975 domain-containing protein [Nonomuraea sp.]